MHHLRELTLLNNHRQSNIGILGGSFNPPHKGHLHIAKTAIRKLNLDMLIWMVTPLNEFKNHIDLPSPINRKEKCLKLLKDNNMSLVQNKIFTLEEGLRTHKTYDTFKRISKLIKHNNVYWLMGEDNIAILNKFYKWQDLADSVSTFSVNRSTLPSRSLNMPFAQIYKSHRVKSADSLLHGKWLFVNTKFVDISSTEIRNE